MKTKDALRWVKKAKTVHVCDGCGSEIGIGERYAHSSDYATMSRHGVRSVFGSVTLCQKCGEGK